MRSSFRERAPAWALAASAALAPATAAAEETAEPIRVAFRARPADACPDEAAFTGEISARTAKARPARPGEAARTFTVNVEVSGRRARGTLAIEEPHGESAAREISGDTCAEVVSALALIAALAIDPKASTAPKPPPPPPPPLPAPRERLPPPPPHAPLPWWGPVAMPLPARPTPAEASRWRWSWGFHAGAASAIAPGLVPELRGACDTSGTCVAAPPMCPPPPYDPCKHLMCKTPCKTCDPGDPDCMEPPGMKECDAMGKCALAPVMCSP